VANTDEPDSKPPPQRTVASNPDNGPELGASTDSVDSGAPTERLPTSAPSTPEGAPAKPVPDPPNAGATVMFTAEDVEKLRGEQAAAEAVDQEGDRLIGTLIRDKWRVLGKLGAGSFGTVYKVEDVKGGWIEALKILGVDRMAGAEAEEMRARFLREAQIMKRLGGDSQHILGLSTYEEDIEAGLIYFLMEFVEGQSLADALAAQGPFPVDRTIQIALQVCDALMAAHEGPEPVVHRDLKLENLMLTTDRSGGTMVKVLDFGIAKIAEREADSRLTTVGTLGTPGYAAPEQLRAEPVDGRTDLFAFGVILYALLTGRDPWLGNLAHEPTHQIYELMVATDRAEVRPIAESGVTIPPAMVNIVMKLLRRNPDQRFQSARELRDALLAFSQGSASADVASLTAVTEEPGVRVAIRDGRNVVAEGPTPCTAADVMAGSYTVEVRDPRYESAETSVILAAGATRTLTVVANRREVKAPPRPKTTKSRGRRLTAAVIVLVGSGAAAYAQPWGRTLDRNTLMTQVERGSVSEVYFTEGGLEGGMQVVPIEALADLRTPFFVNVSEGDIPDMIESLRSRGVAVDASWEIRRITDLAVRAQAQNLYYGLDGADVRSYALRLAELEPDSPEAWSFLFKVGERMAWDAEAALQDGTPDRADQLIEGCLQLVPDQPRCLSVSESL